jgi:hypothetical protein
VVELVCGHLPHACAWGVEANTEQQIIGVSRERVRQIEVCAVEKVQKAVENRVAAIEAAATLPAE